MSSSNLENNKRLLVKSSEKEKFTMNKELENINPKLLNSDVNSTENIDDSFDNLCKQKSINDEKFLQLYDDIAVTGKTI